MDEYPTLFGCATGKDGDIIVIGAPYDRGTDPNCAGCARAPAMLRTLSAPEHLNIKKGALYDLKKQDTLFYGKILSDLGNIRFRATHQTDIDYLKFIADAISVISANGKKPLILGGDHLVTLAVLRGIAQTGKPFQVLHLDAHHDYDAIDSNELPTHASFMAFVAREKLAQKVIQIGVRGLSWGAPAAQHGITTATIADLGQAFIPGMDLYITVDTDAFDPMLAPGVSYPVPDGLSFPDFTQILGAIQNAGLNVIGADWMEYNPVFDFANNITGRVIIHGLAYLIQCLATEHK